MVKGHMQLGRWAEKIDVTYKTAWGMFKRGELNAKKLPSGTIIVNLEDKDDMLTGVIDVGTKNEE